MGGGNGQDRGGTGASAEKDAPKDAEKSGGQ